MTAPQLKLQELMIDWLNDLHWPEPAIEAWLMAEKTHGILAPHIPSWTVRSAIASWTTDRPIRLLTVDSAVSKKYTRQSTPPHRPAGEQKGF